MTYLSRDINISDEDCVKYPTEYLNTINIGCLPNHQIVIKEGVPFIIVRTISPKLSTGTRCVAKRLYSNIIMAEIVNGPHKGEIVTIPRIPLIPSEETNPIVFKRIQFPIKIAYALTMNRVQSQTFEYVGIDFTRQAFAHGQLYTAISRVTRPRNLKVYFPEDDFVAKNPVYCEIL